MIATLLVATVYSEVNLQSTTHWILVKTILMQTKESARDISTTPYDPVYKSSWEVNGLLALRKVQ